MSPSAIRSASPGQLYVFGGVASGSDAHTGSEWCARYTCSLSLAKGQRSEISSIRQRTPRSWARRGKDHLELRAHCSATAGVSRRKSSRHTTATPVLRCDRRSNHQRLRPSSGCNASIEVQPRHPSTESADVRPGNRQAVAQAPLVPAWPIFPIPAEPMWLSTWLSDTIGLHRLGWSPPNPHYFW